MGTPDFGTTQPVTQPMDGEDEEDDSESQGYWGTLISLNNKYDNYRLRSEVTSIGRNPQCEITINEVSVSSLHCKIVRDQEELAQGRQTIWLEDKSTNGTYISKKKKIGKGKRALIQHGSEIIVVPGGKGRERVSFSLTVGDLDKPKAGSIHDKYQIGHDLGAGTFAKVKMCIDRETGDKYAVKIIDKKQFALKGPKRESALFAEVDILKQVSHDNIIQIYDLFDTPESLSIVLELVYGGELFDRIVEMRRFPEDRARNVMQQMLSAIMYLHGRGICHRDLKPENVLFVEKNSDKIKIADFGLSRLVGEASFIKTVCGTPQYLAPDVLEGGEFGYTFAVDYWSMGVILYVLLSGAPPFHERRNTKILDQVRQGSYDFPPKLFRNISETAIDLIKRMLTVDAEKRITGKQMKKHPWILGHETFDAAAEAKANDTVAGDEDDDDEEDSDAVPNDASRAMSDIKSLRTPSNESNGGTDSPKRFIPNQNMELQPTKKRRKTGNDSDQHTGT